MIVIFALSDTVVYPIIMTLLCLIGVLEMLGCVGHGKNLFLSVPSLLCAAASLVLAYFFGYSIMIAVVFLYAAILLAETVFFDKEVNVASVGEVFLPTLYVILCFTALLCLRYIGKDAGEDYIYILVFVAAWMTDTFAYFTGVFFGKHKLIPKISPKKTVEGSIGGIVFCVISFLVFGLIVNKVTYAEMNLAVLAVVGLVLSVIAQVGDLVASSVKRTYGIKDYSNIFPGHGGVLDRFDSIMILAPVLLFVVENVTLFNS